MKTKDFEDFKISLNLNVEVDSSLRKITEKIKIVAQHRDPALLRRVIGCLHATDESLDDVITKHICSDDECKEK